MPQHLLLFPQMEKTVDTLHTVIVLTRCSGARSTLYSNCNCIHVCYFVALFKSVFSVLIGSRQQNFLSFKKKAPQSVCAASVVVPHFPQSVNPDVKWFSVPNVYFLIYFISFLRISLLYDKKGIIILLSPIYEIFWT